MKGSFFGAVAVRSADAAFILEYAAPDQRIRAALLSLPWLSAELIDQDLRVAYLSAIPCGRGRRTLEKQLVEIARAAVPGDDSEDLAELALFVLAGLGKSELVAPSLMSPCLEIQDCAARLLLHIGQDGRGPYNRKVAPHIAARLTDQISPCPPSPVVLSTARLLPTLDAWVTHQLCEWARDPELDLDTVEACLRGLARVRSITTEVSKTFRLVLPRHRRLRRTVRMTIMEIGDACLVVDDSVEE